MSYRFSNIKRYKRGASWEDGSPRMCTRCGYERKGKRKRAVVTAIMQYAGAKTKTPVAYCEDHIPTEVAS